MNIYYKGNILISDIVITQNATHEEEMMKSDYVRLSWDDVSGDTLPVDSYIEYDGEHYSLLEPYSPEQKNEAQYHYEPLFHHPKMYLSKVTFERPSEDTAGNDITYFEWPYTGSATTFLKYIVETIREVFGFTEEEFNYMLIGDFTDKIFSTTFSAIDILSALTTAANACECEWHIDWKVKTLYFGNIGLNYSEQEVVLKVGDNIQVPSRRDSKEGYWNAFQPQGSTRNIMRRAASGEFVQSDVRLSLDREVYPDGIIYTDGEGHIITKEAFELRGERAFIKPLIFEEVYPKLDLYLYNLRYREKYLIDETTDADGNEKRSRVVSHTDESGTPTYARYAIWYFRMAYPVRDAQGEIIDWIDYKYENEIHFKYDGVTKADNTYTFNLVTFRYKEGMFTRHVCKMVHRWVKWEGAESQAESDAIRQFMFYDSTADWNHGMNRDGWSWWTEKPPYEREVEPWSVEPDIIEVNPPKIYNEGQYPRNIYKVTIHAQRSRVLTEWDEHVAHTTTEYEYKDFSYIVTVNNSHNPVLSERYVLKIETGEVTADAEIWVPLADTGVGAYITTNGDFGSPSAKGSIHILDGVDVKLVDKDNSVSTIIDGTKPVLAFQPNTYREKTGVDAMGHDTYRLAESSPLAGLGNGDSKGHYGFVVRFMKMEGKDYIEKANKKDTDELVDDTGILEWQTDRPSTITDADFELEFEQDGTKVIPTTNAQGIIPRSDTQSLNAPTLFANKMNLYNVVVSEASEKAAQAELAEKTKEYITESLTDRNSRTFKSNPVAFEESNPNLYIGRKVVFEDIHGNRLETRVMKLITHLDYDFEQEITVGNEVLKGTSATVQEKVDAIIAGTNGYGNGGMSIEYLQQVIKNWVTPRFLSRMTEDIAEQAIGFAKGWWVKAKGVFGIDGLGNAKLNSLSVKTDAVIDNMITALHGIVSDIQSPNFASGEQNGTGWRITNKDEDGNSVLEVDTVIARMKLITNILEARKYVAMGGNYVYSPAASVIEQIDYYKENKQTYVTTDAISGLTGTSYYCPTSLTLSSGEKIILTAQTYISVVNEDKNAVLASGSGILEFTASDIVTVYVGSLYQSVDVVVKREDDILLGYSFIKVPWLLKLVPLMARNLFYSSTRLVKSGDFDMSEVCKFRVWIKADDGTTKTINTWMPGMLARCQTMDISEYDGREDATTIDTNTGAQKNVFYWRSVIGTGQGRLTIDDGYDHSYIDLSNYQYGYAAGSAAPRVGDSIVCYGASWGYSKDGLTLEMLSPADAKNLSNMVSIETVGDDAPALKEFRGVGLTATVPQGVANHINFSMTGKRKTMISPTSGNEFFAPRFVIETTNGDEVLYNMHRKGDAVALRTQVPARNEFHVGDLVMVNRNGVAKLYKKDKTVGGFWKEEVVEYGDVYHNLEDECLYVATPQGWQNQGTQIDVASFKLEVIGDAETAYARKSGLDWTQTGEYVRSSTESISLLTETKNNGKNLFPGALTGDNWTDEYINTIDLDDDGWFCSKNNEIYSPYVTLVEGTTYTVSFEAESQINVGIFKVQQTETQVETILATRIGTTNRYKATFVAPYSKVMVSFSIDKIFEPQLELGSEATTFTAGADETASLVRQTASSIEAKVNETGINIEDKTVSIKASRFTVTNEAGTVNLIEGNADKNSLTLTNTTVNGALVVHKEVTSGTETGHYNLEISKNDTAPYINYEIVRNERDVQGGHAKDFQSVQIDGDITNGYAVIGASGGILYDENGEEKHRTDYYTHLYPKYLISNQDDYGVMIISCDCQNSPEGGGTGGFENGDRAGLLLKVPDGNSGYNKIRIAAGSYSGYQFVIDFNDKVRITDQGAQLHVGQNTYNDRWIGGSNGKTYVVIKANTGGTSNPNGLYLLYYGGFLIGTSKSAPGGADWTGVTDYTGQL